MTSNLYHVKSKGGLTDVYVVANNQDTALNKACDLLSCSQYKEKLSVNYRSEERRVGKEC